MKIFLRYLFLILFLNVPIVYAQTGIKPPIQGLTSMGNETPMEVPGLANDESLQEIFDHPGVYQGVVLNVSWDVLEPSQNSYVWDVINTGIANINKYTAMYPATPVIGKIRVYAGIRTPSWIINTPGLGFTTTDPTTGDPITLPEYWLPTYHTFWLQLINAMAGQFDTNPAIGAISISSCSSLSAEPFVTPLTGASAIQFMQQAGYTDTLGKACIQDATSDYSLWHNTQKDFSFNPWTDIDSGVDVIDLPFTESIMLQFRTAYKSQATIANHAIFRGQSANNVSMYGYMTSLGPPMEFQSGGPSEETTDTLNYAISVGASEMEEWDSTAVVAHGADVTESQLQTFDTTILAHDASVSSGGGGGSGQSQAVCTAENNGNFSSGGSSGGGGSGGGNSFGPLTLSSTIMNFASNLSTTQNVNISDPNYQGTYTLVSSNTSVVSATYSGNIVTLTPVGAGNAEVIVSDGTNSQSITVTVNATVAPPPNFGPLTVSSNSLTFTSISAGLQTDIISDPNYTGNFSVTSSNSQIATVSLSNQTLTITPGGVSGVTSILISDGTNSQNISVTVQASSGGGTSGPLTISPNALTFNSLISANQNISINDPNYNGQYTVIVSNPTVAGYTIAGNQVVISPIAVGNTTVSISDGTYNKIATIVVNNVSSGGSGSNGPLTLSSSSLTFASTGSSSESVIISDPGFTGQYTATTANSKIVTAYILNKNEVNISPVGLSGSTYVTVSDGTLSASISIAVNASSGSGSSGGGGSGGGGSGGVIVNGGGGSVGGGSVGGGSVGGGSVGGGSGGIVNGEPAPVVVLPLKNPVSSDNGNGAAVTSTGIKLPIHGLVTMGTLDFFYNNLPPDNTFEEANAHPGIYSGVTILLAWDELEPSPGVFNFSSLTLAVSNIKTYNSMYPSTPLVGEIHVIGGVRAPAWAKALDGGPITTYIFSSGSVPGSDDAPSNNETASLVKQSKNPNNPKFGVYPIGLFWTPDYSNAYAGLMNAMAAQFDSNPLIQEIAVSTCGSRDDEQFLLPLNTQGLPVFRSFGYTDDAIKSCIANSDNAYIGWKKTSRDFAFNTFRAIGSSGTTVTLQDYVGDSIMQKVRGENPYESLSFHALLPIPKNENIANELQQMSILGPPIEFQSDGPTVDWAKTFKAATNNNVSEMQIWDTPAAGGVCTVTLDQLNNFRSVLESTYPSYFK